jgi:DNA-binding GntR family transcriptional regulator
LQSLPSTTKLVDQAYAAILDAICDGTLKPGERLTQDEVAQRLNVSRQPIHNALQVLKAQGFVCDTGRRGLAVAPIDPNLFEAIYQLRSAVEPLAVRLATPQLTKEDVAQGEALIERGTKVAVTQKGGAAIAADIEFHSWIYERSGNSLIVDTMRLNWRHLRRSMGEVLRHAPLSKRAWVEHRAILDAMAKGNAERAAMLMQGHVVSAYEDVRTMVAQQGAPAD